MKAFENLGWRSSGSYMWLRKDDHIFYLTTSPDGYLRIYKNKINDANLLTMFMPKYFSDIQLITDSL